MSSLIYKPQYMAMDSSHLAQWVNDCVSKEKKDNQAAANFHDWLERSGYILLITLHHIEELMNHYNTSLVISRLRFLGGMRFLAWIGHDAPGVGPGAVTSLMAAEVRAAYAAPEADISEIVEKAAPTLIQTGTGKALLGPNPDDWLFLRPAIAESAAKTEQVVALARTNLVDISEMKFKNLLSGRLREGEDLRRNLDLLRGSFAKDIEMRGDRRIKDPTGMATTFMRDVEALAGKLPSTAAELVLRCLAMLNVGPDDFGPDSTVGEVLDLGLFRTQMKVVSARMGLPWPDLKQRVRMEQIPSWVISHGLQQYAPDLPERKSSELNDFYLGCLSAYADVTFVDKRTMEAFRRARMKLPLLAKVCRRVEKAALYRDIPAILSK